MANIAKTYTLVNGQPADATQVNKNFDDIINGVGDVTTLRPTVASLGLDADIATLALPANTTISAAGAELINEANAAAQIARLGAVGTGDARLSDARPASDVSAWAKAASKPSYTAAEVGTKGIARGSFTGTGSDVVVTHGLGTTPFLVLLWVEAGTIRSTASISSTTFSAPSSSNAALYHWLAIA